MGCSFRAVNLEFCQATDIIKLLMILEDVLPDIFIRDLQLLKLSENGKENKSLGFPFCRVSSADLSHL